METESRFFFPGAEALIQQHGGPLTVPGQQGEYVIMRSDIYTSLLGIGEEDEAETLASVRRGIADLNTGRTRDIDDVFNDLEARHEP